MSSDNDVEDGQEEYTGEASFVLMEINTERFIDEVKLRPSLWNSASEEFKDRLKKKSQWAEMCALFYPNFVSGTPKEKSEMCTNLQTKFRNLRDSYRKHLKSLNTKSGKARQSHKMYVYAAQLSFLDSTIKLGPREPSASEPVVELYEHNTEYSTDDSDMIERKQHLQPPTTSNYRRKKARLEENLENYDVDTFQTIQALQKEDESCDDLDFFKSLIPMVKPLSNGKKLKLRMEIMSLVYNYLQREPE